jgi:hypothetical protein
LTIYSAADESPASNPNKAAAPHVLDRVGDLFAALRVCWTPPGLRIGPTPEWK